MSAWKIIDTDPSYIEQRFHVSALTARILQASGLSDEKIEELLKSDDELMTSQSECVGSACRRIIQARDHKEKVMIAGDYDADGVCSTAIMKDVLDQLGIANGYYIPDRFKEGYGLRPETVQKAHDKGYTLIITVDNGVKAMPALHKARELGMEVIVSDHHQIEEEVPADILVHPTLMEPAFAYLSGAGTALQISRTLLQDCPAHTALAAIAAIGDVMPLYRQTRVIVRKGLRAIHERALPSVSALVRKGQTIDETAAAFQIVPKLNSVGRMNDISNVNTLVPFLLSTDPQAIQAYASQLEKVNTARRTLSAKMADAASAMNTDSDFPVLYDAEFHEGLCGLVAGRLASQLHKPCLVLAQSDGLIKGSGRSVPGFNLFAFFSEDFDELTAFGGHEQAVGLSFPADSLEEFCTKVQKKMAVSGFIYQEPTQTAICIPSEEITLSNIMDLQVLSPYPRDIMQPLFAVHDLKSEISLQSEKVTKYRFAGNGCDFDGVLFRFRNIDTVDNPNWIIGRLSINKWRESVRCQMDIEGFEG